MSQTKKKIVIIDDETDLGILMKDGLDDEQIYEVFLTDDPEEGEKVCARESPDLVLLDYVMPKLYGNEVVSFLRTNPRTEKTKIVIMSGLVAIREQREKAQDKKAVETFASFILQSSSSGAPWVLFSPKQIAQHGVNAFIAKPFLRKDLFELVRTVLMEK
jgi:CheY-like chemotaxis protein